MNFEEWKKKKKKKKKKEKILKGMTLESNEHTHKLKRAEMASFRGHKS